MIEEWNKQANNLYTRDWLIEWECVCFSVNYINFGLYEYLQEYLYFCLNAVMAELS